MKVSEAIGECINNPLIQSMCMRKKYMTYDEKRKCEENFSRVVGFCMLFKDIKDIEEYMLINKKDEQKDFIKKKIAEKLDIKIKEIPDRDKEIFEYAYKNFKENGYVFHAGNSFSIGKNMENGLNGNGSNIEQKKELLHIASIYGKYDRDKPLGWGIIDIENNNDGWFYDGSPENALYYADSPEWFNQFCGGNLAYSYEGIEEEKRHGYTNRDYNTCLETVTGLIEKNKMTDEDKKEILDFFNKYWNLFRDTTPTLLLVPAEQVEKMDMNMFYEIYGKDKIYNDICSGEVRCNINVCCKKKIEPDKLEMIDLTPILPRFKIQRNMEKEMTLNECMKMLKGFDIEKLKKAQNLLKSLESKERSK